MGNPEQNYPCVHIAGTNGKGSVALIISSVLQQAGYRVGRFISPHIHSYRERFSVNNQEIKEDILLDYLQKIEANLNKMCQEGYERVTEFELLTAIAFEYFKDSKVDVAVLETGMGGLYDSTNVVSPLISIITGVDYDHQSYLGNSLKEIALNKAGIIKPGVPVVVGDMDEMALQVIKDRADSQGSSLFPASLCQVKRRGNHNIDGQVVEAKCPGLEIDRVYFSLLGDFQLQNLAVALTSLMVLKQQGYSITNEHIINTLSTLKHPGRMELISSNPPIILDVAHNPQAARQLAYSLKNLFPHRRCIMVCGMLDDKDSMAILQELGGDCRACVVTRPESQRGVHWQRVAAQWLMLYPDKEVWVKEDIEEAVKTGISLLGAEEYLLVAGSFYILDRARRYLMTT
ncbi:MAG: bifunctional folylpolyglutamate synthase/dihydrofolate synthase [Syntrophomonadaceae bacterium]|jgi:dihydrofolate synthase/folylpolyglutamate synthase|nr:bifunctional folylpolyglutamate synthase/dihydrofolate synthase [Syntrophomonadaceae bacterium]